MEFYNSANSADLSWGTVKNGTATGIFKDLVDNKAHFVVTMMFYERALASIPNPNT